MEEDDSMGWVEFVLYGVLLNGNVADVQIRSKLYP